MKASIPAILFQNGKKIQTEGYCTDVFFDTALRWIRGKVEKREPFFAYMPTNEPYGPFQDVPEDELEQ